MPAIKIDTFYGWHSQNEDFFAEWQHIYSMGISHQKNPRYLQLDDQLQVLRSDQFTTQDITAIFDNGSTVFIWTDEWKIYDTTTGNPLRIALPSGEEVRYGYVFQNKVYVSTSNGSDTVWDDFYSIAVSNTTSTWDVWDLTTEWTSTGLSCSMIWWLNSNLFVVGWDVSAKNVGWTDWIVPYDGVFESDLLDLVIGTTITANTLRVYTQTSLTIVDLWSLTVIDTVQFPFRVNSITGSGDIDYGLAEINNLWGWTEYALYAFSGLSHQRIVTPTISASYDQWQSDVTNFSRTSKFETWFGRFVVRAWDWLVYVGGGANTWFVYGSRIPWLSPSISEIPTYDSEGHKVQQVNFLHVFNGDLYIAYTANNINKIGKYSMYDVSGTKTSEGMWISRKLDMWDKSRRKHLQELRIGKQWTASELYIRPDEGSWTLLATLNESGRFHRVINPQHDFYEAELGLKITESNEKISSIEVRFDFLDD